MAKICTMCRLPCRSHAFDFSYGTYDLHCKVKHIITIRNMLHGIDAVPFPFAFEVKLNCQNRVRVKGSFPE
jgi:hypothetical protein